MRRSKGVAALKERVLGHDWKYDAEYYEKIVDGPAVASAPRMVASILEDLKPSSVIDVGCGTGALLATLRDAGCEAFGLEYSERGLAYCRERGLDVRKFDLENQALDVDRTFDVAVSLEVAEHLPAEVADRYVDLLTSVAPVVVFTAAPPGQGGRDHVNEQPPSYWIEKFARRGFVLLEGLTERWREGWRAGGDVVSWYHANLMVFRASETLSR